MTQAGALGKIRVAHFIGSLNIGGAENQVTMLVNALEPGRFERHVITLGEAAQGFRGMLDEDVKYFCINYRRRNAPFALYRLYCYLKDQRIDILHCHMYHAAVKGAAVSAAAGVRAMLVSEHGKNTWKRWWNHLIERQLISRFARIRVAVSEDIRRLRIEQGGIPAESIILMPNAVGTRVPMRDNAELPRRIGSLGRLVDAKDFTVLLKASRILLDRGYDITLEIAGEGKQRPVLEKAIDDMGLQAAVSLPGVKNGAAFLSSIDVFVMSSKREGVPVALLEAMAHGLPIVATAVGGIPETVRDGQESLLSPSGQPEALAANIARIINERDLRIRLGSAARERVRERYGIETIVEEWEQLYAKLLGGITRGV